MTSIAEFTLPASDFPLGRVFEDRPGVRFELDRVVPSADTFMPYFWAYGSDMEAIRAVFADLPELRSVKLMEDLGDRGLFRAEWNPEAEGVMNAIAESGVTVLSATGSREGWLFELRTETPEAFSTFQQRCAALGTDVTLTRLSRISEVADGAEAALTPEQREALVLAYEEGYYDDPRGTDLESLASQLGITRQAFAARLRRGYRNLVGSTLVSDTRDGPPRT